MSRIRAQLQVDVPLRQLFATPTVAGLSAAILERMMEQVGDEELARMMDEIEGETTDGGEP